MAAAGAAFSGSGEGGGKQAGRHGAIDGEAAEHQPLEGAGEAGAEFLAGAGFFAFAEQDAGAEKVVVVEGKGGKGLFQFAFDPKVKRTGAW